MRIRELTKLNRYLNALPSLDEGFRLLKALFPFGVRFRNCYILCNDGYFYHADGKWHYSISSKNLPESIILRTAGFLYSVNEFSDFQIKKHEHNLYLRIKFSNGREFIMLKGFLGEMLLRMVSN